MERTNYDQKKSYRRSSVTQPRTCRAKSSPAQRVIWLLEQVWNGNRSEMGRAIGCSHSVLTKIAAGQQAPGRHLLTAIAAHPKVNPTWLMSGEGEPLLAERSDSPAEGWPLPIARQIIVGPPAQYRTLLSGEHFPVTGAFYQPSRYWLEIQPSDPITRSRHNLAKDGDLLLMETDPVWWKETYLVDGRTCVVRVQINNQEQHKLSYVMYSSGGQEEPESLLAELFGGNVDRDALTTEIILRKPPGGDWAIRQQYRNPDSPAARTPGKRARQISLGPQVYPIQLHDILAVCLMLVRRF